MSLIELCDSFILIYGEHRRQKVKIKIFQGRNNKDLNLPLCIIWNSL